MAGYRGHIAGAIAANAGYLAGLELATGSVLTQTNGVLSGWQFFVALFTVAILFGLWPDVDTNSKGQNLFVGIAFIADILLIIAGRFEAAAYLGLLAMTPIVGKHRGWTHSKLAMVLVPLPIALVSYMSRPELLTTALIIYGAAVAGYFSHLLLDGLIIKQFRIKGDFKN